MENEKEEETTTRKVGKLEINNMSEINFYFIFQILSGFFFLILFLSPALWARREEDKGK